MYKYFDQILSKYQCGFRQGYNTQHCLLVMIEKWKEILDKGGLGGDKCNLLVTTEKSVSIKIDGSNVENKKEQKLLGSKVTLQVSVKKLVKSYMHYQE